MADTRLTEVFSKAGDYKVPLGTYMDKPKNLEAFLNERAEWEKITNTQMVFISPAFAEKLFGNSSHANYAGILFNDYSTEMTKPIDHRNTAMAQRDLHKFIPLLKKAVAEFYDARDISLIEQLPEEELITFAKQAQDLHSLRYGEATHGKIFGSMSSHDIAEGKRASFMALGDVKDISLETSFPKDFLPALGKTENFQFDPRIMRAYILAHELEHANQDDIEHVSESWQSDASHEKAAQSSYLKELDATISAKQVLEDLLPEGEMTKYLQVMDLAYLHAYIKRLGNIGNSDLHVYDADHQILPQMNEYFGHGSLHGEIGNINEATKELSKKIATHMGASFTDEDHMHKIYEITGQPSMGQLKTALREMISDENNPLPPEQLSLASAYLEGMDNLGISAKNYDAIKEADAKIIADIPKPNRALFESAIQSNPAPATP